MDMKISHNGSVNLEGNKSQKSGCDLDTTRHVSFKPHLKKVSSA